MARRSVKDLQEEFHKLDLLTANGRLLTRKGIKRWVKLYRRLYKNKSLGNQSFLNSKSKLRKQLTTKAYGTKTSEI